MRSIIHAEGVRECLLKDNFRLAGDSGEIPKLTAKLQGLVFLRTGSNLER
jgi:hypothetical protein